ncbi:MAG: hypothetical protein WC556_13265 [Candidatus Methanoperedens sp.]
MHIKTIKSKTGGFNFAITAVTAILASIYYLYSYIQNTAIAPIYYVRLIGFVSVALIFLMFLLLYIFIQGYALGLQDPKDYELKRKNERFASSIYLLAFLIFIMLSTNVLLFFIPSDWIPFLSADPENFDRKIYYIMLYLISALASFRLGWPYIKSIEEMDWSTSFFNEKIKPKLKKLGFILKDFFCKKFRPKLAELVLIFKGFFSEKIKQKFEKLYFIIKNIFIEKFRKELTKFSLIIDNRNKNVESLKIPQYILILYFALFFLGIAMLYWLIVFIVLLNSSLLSGHVVIDMGNIYSKDDTPIPVYIKKTGPIYDSQLKLYKEYSKDNLIPIDNLSLNLAEINSSKKVTGDNSILSGNAFELGTYYIYINTSNVNMTTGYYELRYSISQYEYGKSFYLK